MARPLLQGPSMSLNIELLRESFTLVVERQPMLVRRFYEILFERHPEARHLFGRRSAEAQEKMLTSALIAVMDHLDDAPWFTTTLSALGAKHREYGVTDRMYDWVGESLLATLAEIAGDDWNAELEREWSKAYAAIATTMQQGARSVAA
jgi:hemoglobin-like flavoprotein